MPRLSRRNVRKGGKGRKGKGGMFPQQQQQQPLTRSDSSEEPLVAPPGQSVPRTNTLGPRPFPSKCQREEDALKACERGESTSSGFMSGMGNFFGNKGNNSGGGRKSRRRGRKSHRRGRKSRRRGRKSRRRSRR